MVYIPNPKKKEYNPRKNLDKELLTYILAEEHVKNGFKGIIFEESELTQGEATIDMLYKYIVRIPVKGSINIADLVGIENLAINGNTLTNGKVDVSYISNRTDYVEITPAESNNNVFNKEILETGKEKLFSAIERISKALYEELKNKDLIKQYPIK